MLRIILSESIKYFAVFRINHDTAPRDLTDKKNTTNYLNNVIIFLEKLIAREERILIYRNSRWDYS